MPDDTPDAPAPPVGIDLRAAQVFIHLERDRIAAYVRRHLPIELASDVNDADVVHDVFFEAFRRIGQFGARDRTSAYRWLVTIARNRMVALLRAHRAARRGGGRGRVPAGSDALAGVLSEVAACRRTPSLSAMSHELRLAVEAAVGRLPDDYRAAIEGRYLHELTPAQVGAKMGRTERAVHMLCNRGLKALRRDLRSASRYA